MALANALAGTQVGIRRFDASVGGLGGCPFSPGATGNVCTEDLVHLFHTMDLETGIDLDRLIVVATDIEAELGTTLPSRMLRAGPRFARNASCPSPPTWRSQERGRPDRSDHTYNSTSQTARSRERPDALRRHKPWDRNTEPHSLRGDIATTFSTHIE